MKSFLKLCLFFAFSVACFSQVDSTSSSVQTEPKDTTVYFKYIFHRGDTLTYKTSANDSIIIDYGKALIKERNELVHVVCDSIGKNGHYYLSQTLLAVYSKERYDKEEVIRNESDWIGRRVQYEIDTLGLRYSYAIDDTSTSALTPGGSFQPIIFVPFGKSPVTTSSSWIHQDTVELPENGVPWSLVKNSYLYDCKNLHDSLDQKIINFEYVKTGIGSNWVITSSGNVKNSAILAAYGEVIFSQDKGIPIRHFETIQQKLKIKTIQGEEMDGMHFSNVTFELIDLTKFVSKKIKEKPKTKKSKAKRK